MDASAPLMELCAYIETHHLEMWFGFCLRATWKGLNRETTRTFETVCVGCPLAAQLGVIHALPGMAGGRGGPVC